MPNLDGLELIRLIREAGRPSYTYVILLTVRDAKEDVVSGLETGADDYLTKPFSLDELRARVVAGERILSLEARLNRSRERMEKLATYDTLTSLLNRWAIERHAEAELSRVQREGGSLSLLMLDIDHFKLVNDRHGHLIGDEALRLLAHLLTENLRPYDWAGRWGGEEFLVLLPETDLVQAAVVAERIRAGVEESQLPLPDGSTLQVQVSVGVASTSIATEGIPTLNVLLWQTDEALYRAKRAGRNRVCAFEGAEA
jgi:two-component system chemotaxis response regulator CheY